MRAKEIVALSSETKSDGKRPGLEKPRFCAPTNRTTKPMTGMAR
jgi:hypothetical protein